MLKVNEYFEGGVKSISFKTPEGDASIGVMEAGAYEFGTSSTEYMTVITGCLHVKLPGSDTWNMFTAGQTFIVAANERFQLRVDAESAYLCLYK
jgi:purine/pyrimidine-nucleoside phosphorylase